SDGSGLKTDNATQYPPNPTAATSPFQVALGSIPALVQPDRPPRNDAAHFLQGDCRGGERMSTALPQFLAEMMDSPPRAGEGVHTWLFRVARQLHAHLPATEIVRLLESKVAACGRHVPQREIIGAVQSSMACAWQPKNSSCSKGT